MALILRKQAASSVGTPSSSARVAYFVDENGNPTLKDSTGATSSAVSVDGSPLVVNEQGSAPAAENDKGKIYSKDISGVTELFYRDDLANGGNEIQITSNGALNAGGGSGMWFDSGSSYITSTEILREQLAIPASSSANTAVPFTVPAGTNLNISCEIKVMAATAGGDTSMSNYYVNAVRPSDGTLSVQQNAPLGNSSTGDHLDDGTTVTLSTVNADAPGAGQIQCVWADASGNNAEVMVVYNWVVAQSALTISP